MKKPRGAGPAGPGEAGAWIAPRRYFVVLLVSVSVRVAEPIGVSTRSVEVVRERSVVESGLLASMFTLVDELDGGVGCTTVVEELGALGAGCTTVVEELPEGGASFCSFTTVVEDEGPGRSHPASAATASAAVVSMISLMEISVVHDWEW